jgi:hypothetical protein
MGEIGESVDGFSDAALGQHRFDPGYSTTHQANASRVVELATLLLDVKVEQFFSQFTATGRQLVTAQFFKFFNLHRGRQFIRWAICGSFLGAEKSRLEAATLHKTAPHTEFVGRKAKGFLSGGLWRSRHFEEHMARADYSDPSSWSTLTFTHPCLRWASRNWLVRKNTDPNFSLSLQVAVDGDPAGLDLLTGDPAALKRLQSILSEVHLIAAARVTRAAASLALPELNFFGHQCHSVYPFGLAI